MTGLYRRGEVWWFRWSPLGRGQVRVSTGETDEIEAMRVARDLMERPEQLDYSDQFSAEVAGYIAHKKRMGRSANWCANAQHWLQAAMEAFGDPDPRKLTTTQIQAWFDGLCRDKRPQTAHTYLTALSRMLRWLVETGRLRRNPCEGVKVPRLKPSVRKRFLTQAEARKLLDTCQDDGLKFAIYCGLHAGLRKEEVIQARPSWFDLDAGLLHVTGDAHWHPKDRDNRTIPLTDEFREWLKARTWPGPFMLAPTATKGAHRYRWDFRRAYNTHVAACGLEDVTFHDLRRTFASLLVSSGISLYKVSRWLGDGPAVVEKNYGHLIPQDSEVNAPWAKNK